MHVQITAGLAGLAAAISIQNEDFQVTVLESTKELTEVGAGLQIVRLHLYYFKKYFPVRYGLNVASSH